MDSLMDRKITVMNDGPGHEEHAQWLVNKEAQTKAELQVCNELGRPPNYVTESEHGPNGFLAECDEALSKWASRTPERQEWLKTARAIAFEEKLEAARRDAQSNASRSGLRS